MRRKVIAIIAGILAFNISTTSYAYDSIAIQCQKESHSYNLNDDDLYKIAQIVECEAGNQSLKGKELVARVMLNRYLSPDFPQTIDGVIHQPGQFATASYYSRRTPSSESLYAVYQCISGSCMEEVLFFRRTNEGSWHDRHLEYLFTEGDHSFYKLKES